MEWRVDVEAWTDAEKKSAEQVAMRARTYFERRRKELPRLSKKQSAALVDMLCAAFHAGRRDGWWDGEYEDMKRRKRLSSRGVKGRQAKAAAARNKVVAAFTAAARAGRDVAIETIAAECGVSRATAYRALQASKSK